MASVGTPSTACASNGVDGTNVVYAIFFFSKSAYSSQELRVKALDALQKKGLVVGEG